jgi:hypothetical protein
MRSQGVLAGPSSLVLKGMNDLSLVFFIKKTSDMSPARTDNMSFASLDSSHHNGA